MPRLEIGRAARPVLFTGIRGVGKTALLTVARRDAANRGLPVVRLEATKRAALVDALVFQLEEVLTRLSSRLASTRRALEDLAEFKVGVSVAGTGVEVSTRRDRNPPPSTERLFRTLLTSAARAAHDDGHPLVLVIDELQQGPPELLGPLLTAVHEAIQDEIPLGVIAAGLPYTLAWVATHVTYGERMFDHHNVGLLDDAASARAYTETLALIPDETLAPGALAELVRLGQGLPYFIQEFGSATWRTARDEPISRRDVNRAAPAGTEAIAGFHRQRWTEASAREQGYLVALARLPDEPQRSGAVASTAGMTAAAAAPYRRRLIRDKGILVEPARGLVHWSLPGFRDWLRAEHDPHPADEPQHP